MAGFALSMAFEELHHTPRMRRFHHRQRVMVRPNRCIKIRNANFEGYPNVLVHHVPLENLLK